MKTARLAVLGVALAAGIGAAVLASTSKPPAIAAARSSYLLRSSSALEPSDRGQLRWRVGIGKRRINRVLDCDVQSFFDKVSQDWLIRFVEHRIGDRRIIRLITKWLKAGVLEDGRLVVTEEGTPQGAVMAP